MTTETILTEGQIQQAVQCITAEQSIVDGSVVLSNVNICFRELEKAVLQSPEVQRLREDALRWQAFRLAMHNEDSEILNRIEVHIENAIDNADGVPTEDQIDAAIDAAMGKQP